MAFQDPRNHDGSPKPFAIAKAHDGSLFSKCLVNGSRDGFSAGMRSTMAPLRVDVARADLTPSLFNCISGSMRTTHCYVLIAGNWRPVSAIAGSLMESRGYEVHWTRAGLVAGGAK